MLDNVSAKKQLFIKSHQSFSWVHTFKWVANIFQFFYVISLVTFILFSSICDRSYCRQLCIRGRIFILKCIVSIISALNAHHNSSKNLVTMYCNGHK